MYENEYIHKDLDLYTKIFIHVCNMIDFYAHYDLMHF